MSHATDNASTDATTYRSTPGESGAQADRGDADFDIRHAFTTGATWFLPSPNSRGIVHAVFSDWSLDAFVLGRSAPPVDVTGPINFTASAAIRSRPNRNAGVALEFHGEQYPGGKILNAAAFTTVPPGEQGNLARNVLRGFGASQVDAALQRQFRVTDRVTLRFRAEFFNIFNQAHFGSPVFDLSSPLFGRSTQTLASSLGSGGANGGFSPLYQIGGPRSIQFVARLAF